MDAKEFIRELVRMCQARGEICGDCRLHREIGCPLVVPERVDADKLVSAVEEWSKENPFVTNGDKVMEIIKDAGVPVTARGSGFDREVTVNTVHIAVSEDWWDAEYKGGE